MSTTDAVSTTERVPATDSVQIGRGGSGRLPGRFLRSELGLVLSRRRNQVGLLVLAVVPILLAVAVKVSAPSGGGGPDFLSLITGNGLFVAYAALTVEIAMFLPLAVALISGDAIAGEAHLGTLRYLLVVPVNRTRLLVVKYLSLCIGAFAAVALVALVGVIAGGVFFGHGPMTTLSGSQLGLGTSLLRLLVAVGYLTVGLCAFAAVGLFLSTLTEQPIAATIALLMIVIVSTILGSLPQLAWLHPWLITDHWTAILDLVRDPIAWDGLLRGLGLDAIYVVVFWLAAWARFTTKDITH